MRHALTFFVCAVVALVAAAVVLPSVIHPAAQARSTMPALTDWQVIDLTQPLNPNIPIWPGDPEFEIRPWATYEVDYYFINRISIGEHSGTHWGTPNTFIEGARSAEMITVDELVVPAVVIDVRDKAAEDADFGLSVDDITAWEADNGTIPPGSVAILWTGWQDKWGNPAAFIGEDAEGTLHWPGFRADTAEFLIAERGVIGLGTDTHGVDPGNDEEFGASFAMYDADGMILECLTGLDQLPPVGATLVIGGWPIEGGSGSPARIFAFLPPAER
jgi:kynurenine formamidase